MYIRKLQKNISILRSSKINKTNNDRTTNNERKSNIYATHPINEEQQRISNRTVLINVSENKFTSLSNYSTNRIWTYAFVCASHCQLLNFSIILLVPNFKLESANEIIWLHSKTNNTMDFAYIILEKSSMRVYLYDCIYKSTPYYIIPILHEFINRYRAANNAKVLI